MYKTRMEHFEVEKDIFDHFSKGDCKVRFDLDNGEFITAEQLEKAFKDTVYNTDEDKEKYLLEHNILKSYQALDILLDYLTNGDYDLDYLIVGNTVIMSIARRY